MLAEGADGDAVAADAGDVAGRDGVAAGLDGDAAVAALAEEVGLCECPLCLWWLISVVVVAVLIMRGLVTVLTEAIGILHPVFTLGSFRRGGVHVDGVEIRCWSHSSG